MLIIATTDRQRCSQTPEAGKTVSMAQALAFARSRKPMAKPILKRRKRI